MDTYEVRKLLEQRDKCDSFSRERAQRKLDDVANRIRFGGESLVGESGADRDEVIEGLSSSGADSFYSYWYGD